MRRAALLAALLGTLTASTAHASYDPLGSGTTKLALDRDFVSFLAHDGIRIAPTAPGGKRGSALVFPVSGGQMDPTAGKGEIEAAGGFAFVNSRKRVPLKALVVKTNRSPLVAKVGGSQLKVATAKKIGLARSGFGTAFTARKLTLTAKVATRLNKKLRPKKPFAEGQPLGTLKVDAQPQLSTIEPSGRASVVFDAAFLAKLDAHFVSVNPVFPAEHQGGTFTMPIIADGALAPDGTSGTLRTGGDVEFLRLGSGQIFWHELWFDLGQHLALAEADLEPTPAFPGKLGQVPVLDLGEGAIASDPQARTISLAAAPLTLQASVAQSFDKAFAEGKEDFRTGELVGTVSFRAQGQ